MTTPEAWPLVDVHDDGIRPAGSPDACFYCRRKVGEPHKQDCVMVHKLVEHRVTVDFPDGGVARGLWIFEEPHEWDQAMSEFHKNEGSWCANNLLRPSDASIAAGFDVQPVQWEHAEDAEKVRALKGSGGGCLCSYTGLELVRVVDPTPRRKITKVST